MGISIKPNSLEGHSFNGRPRYPDRITIEGGDGGLVVDDVWESPELFDQVSFELQKRGMNPKLNKVHVSGYEIVSDDSGTITFSINFGSNDSMTITLDESNVQYQGQSLGGNLMNAAINFATFKEALSSIEGYCPDGFSLPEVEIRAVYSEAVSFLISSVRAQLESIRVPGDHRRSFIIKGENDNIILTIGRAVLEDKETSEPLYENGSHVFILGKEPFSHIKPGYFEYVLDHKKRFPESRIYFLPSSDQIKLGSSNFITLLAQTDILSLNLDEACDFFRLIASQSPHNKDRKFLAKWAVEEGLAMGVKKVCITDAENGIYYAERSDVEFLRDHIENDKQKQQKENLNESRSLERLDCLIKDVIFRGSDIPYSLSHIPIVHMNEVQSLLDSHLSHETKILDDETSDTLQSFRLADFHTTGCGDSVASTIFFLDFVSSFKNIRPEQKAWFANVIALMISRIKESNLGKVNPEVISALLNLLDPISAEEYLDSVRVNEGTRNLTRELLTLENVKFLHNMPDLSEKSQDRRLPFRKVAILVGAKGTGKTEITHSLRTEFGASIHVPKPIAIGKHAEEIFPGKEFVFKKEGDVRDLIVATRRYDTTVGYDREALRLHTHYNNILLHSSSATLHTLIDKLEEEYGDALDISIVYLSQNEDKLAEEISLGRSTEDLSTVEQSRVLGIFRNRLSGYLRNPEINQHNFVVVQKDYFDDDQDVIDSIRRKVFGVPNHEESPSQIMPENVVEAFT